MNIKDKIISEENIDAAEEYSNINQNINDEIHEDFNDNKIFKYLKEVSNNISLKEVASAQYNLFQNIKVKDPNSVLAKYLSEKSIEKDENNKFKIIPFGFNTSQKEAVQTALNNQISIIESSSITSRRDVVLNIVLNIAMDGKTSAIVTNNNFSASKFFEMFKQCEINFICENLTEGETDSSRDENRKDIDENKNLQRGRGELKDIQNILGEILDNEEKLILLQMQKNNLINENSSLDNVHQVNLPSSVLNLTADKLMALLEEYNMLIERDKNINFLYKIIFLFKYGITNFEFYNNTLETIRKSLLKRYNKLKLQEIDEEINNLKDYLDRYNIEDEIKRHKENSLRILKSILYKRYENIIENNEESGNLNNILNKYPIIIASTDSFINCAAIEHVFDYVIIDEGSRMDIVTGALIMSCARNVVIIGEINQAFDNIQDKTNAEWDEIYSRYEINEAYNYSKNSLLSSAIKIFNDAPKTVLMRQYRDSKDSLDSYNDKRNTL